MHTSTLSIFVLLIICSSATCWEMDMYDLVEELDHDFYTLLEVDRSADYKDIRKAFKKLSLIHHPDKSDDPNAGEKFRQLVAVHEILRDSEKRIRYNDVLDNGLPDWRHAVYYYRRVRKMGLLEMLAILFVIITVGQYIVGWAAYLERRYIVDEYVETQRKRLLKQKKKGKIDELPDMEFDIPRPSVYNTLPFQIPKLAWTTVLSIPISISYLIQTIKEKREPIEESSSEEEEVEQEAWGRGPRRRRNFVIPEAKNDSSVPVGSEKQQARQQKAVVHNQPVSGGLWTDDDLAELIKLVNKYPPGTAKRWEKVAEALNRPVPEVIHMSKKVKEGMVVRTETEEENGEAVAEKVKTKGGKLGPGDYGEKEWSNAQQKSLEDALVKFPKQVAERWERIAKIVPGKTKEECMMRYKYLAEAVRKKKEEESTTATS